MNDDQDIDDPDYPGDIDLDSPQASVPKILRLSNSSLATVDADEVQDDIDSISSQSSTTSDVVTPALRVRTRGGLSCRGGRGGFRM